MNEKKHDLSFLIYKNLRSVIVISFLSSPGDFEQNFKQNCDKAKLSGNAPLVYYFRHTKTPTIPKGWKGVEFYLILPFFVDFGQGWVT